MSTGVDAQRFSSFVLELYRVAREVPAPEFQEAVLTRLKPVLRFESSMWGTGSMNGRHVEVHAMHLHEQPAEMVASWSEVSDQDTVVSIVRSNPGRVANIHTPTLFGGKREKAGILDHAVRFGAGNGLVTVHEHPGMPLLSWISLYRKDPDAHYSEEERQLFEALFPHIVEALTINRLLYLDTVFTSRQSRRPAAAVVDAKGMLHTTDGAFEALVGCEWPDWPGKVLPAGVVNRLVDSSRYRGTKVVLAWERVGDLYFMRGRTLEPVDLLSFRERQVAQLFAEGKSHKEIARLLDLSPATVRNVIQAAYAKLHVGDKAEMATLLARAA